MTSFSNNLIEQLRPSETKMEKIKQLSNELLQEKGRLIKTLYVIKMYTEYNDILQIENKGIDIKNLQTKVENIIKTKEVQKGVKLKGKNGEVLSLFGLSDSFIADFYGNPALGLKEKQFLKEGVNNHMLNNIKKDTGNVFKENNTPSYKGSYLDNKMKTLDLFNTLQTKIILCKNLLLSVEGSLQELITMQSSNKEVQNTHVVHIVREAQVLTQKAKMIEMKTEEAMKQENGDLITAMDILKRDLEKYYTEDKIKLLELNGSLEKYKQMEATAEYQKLLKTYLHLIKELNHYNFVIETINHRP